MRAIDADALLTKAIEGRRFTISYKDIIRNEFVIRTAYQDLADFLNSAPTLTLDDLRPRAKWVHHDFVSPTLECSLCGGLAGMDCCGDYHSEQSAFCPACGADMRGGVEDG